jgi:hypothetical protein
MKIKVSYNFEFQFYYFHDKYKYKFNIFSLTSNFQFRLIFCLTAIFHKQFNISLIING